MENIATIQKIKSVKHHPNADALDIVQVLGWQVVTKRDEYTVGDLTVYIAIDSVLPDKPVFEMLRNKNFRIRPIRLRGEESAGICFPLSILPTDRMDAEGRDLYEGYDVTELLDVKHYEKPVPASLAGQAVGNFPSFLTITDEKNLRSYPDAIAELHSRPYYITRKDDGSSGTYFIRNGEFGVCSRRIHLKDSEENGFWKMSRKYNIQEVLKKSFPNRNIALQGEVVGPGIQGNNLGLKELEFHLFNLYDSDSRIYLNYDDLISFTTEYNIPMVKEVDSGNIFTYSLEELIKMSRDLKYDNGKPAEGIVIRPKEGFYSSILKKYWSGKVINELYKEVD